MHNKYKNNNDLKNKYYDDTKQYNDTNKFYANLDK